MKQKRILTIIIALICILTGLNSTPFVSNAKNIDACSAQENTVMSDELPDGDIEPIEMIRIPEEEDVDEQSDVQLFSNEFCVEASPSAVYRNNWEIYGNDYCYQNLNENQKALYDAMKAQCLQYMNEKIDAKSLTVNGNQVYGIGKFEYNSKGLSSDEIQNLVYLFVYQNPQYYFLSKSVYYNSKIFYLSVYEAFSDGDARSIASKQMYEKVDAWISQIKNQPTQYSKEKLAHDIVCQETVYREGEFDQTAYSAVMEGGTVCAGYAKLYAILTNAAGLETVCVTSETHGWNRTKLGDKWYNVDTTWDDGSTITYRFFNKSDKTMQSYDGSSRESHTQHDYYDDVAPECFVDLPYVEATEISVSPTDFILYLDGTKTKSLTTKVLPETTSDKGFIFESGDTSVVTVSASGVVTAVAPGKTTVTVRKATSGQTAVCNVEVYGNYETPSAPSLSKRTSTSIRLLSELGCLYSMDKIHWQSDSSFTGLKPYTYYTFYAKKAANGYYRESPVSAGTQIRTLADGEKEIPEVSVSYRTHVQTFGWEKDWKKDGTMSGTSGKAKRLEAIRIQVTGNNDLGIRYTTHCQTYGWLPWASNGELNGTEGEAKRLEAIKIQLTGADKDEYDIYYRVHAQSYGWLGWAKNGEPAGTAGYAKRLEAIQICVVRKEKSFNQIQSGIKSAYSEAYKAKSGTSPVVGGKDTSNQNPQIGGTEQINVAYKTHVQTYGWQGWKYNGQMSGTQGQAKRLEAINIKLTNQKYSGDIRYITHVQTYGWQGDVNNTETWKKNGDMAGTSGKAKRLEAICITLTGEMANHYDVYYRVHAQSFGWLDWAKNGAPAGTAGYAKRLEGIQIVLVPKDGKAPGSTVRPYVSK